MWNVITLDGLFEGERAWDLPWHLTVWDEQLERLSLDQLGAADLLVFGRVTYEGMAAYWRTEKGPIADAMNRLPKLACSRTLATADWTNSTIARDAVAEVAARKSEGDGDMYVFGSAILSHALLAAGLFDELRLAIAPVLHGRGRRLFDDVAHANLALLENRTLRSGAVLLRYAPARAA
jgi:dihydrofolate reductase